MRAHAYHIDVRETMLLVVCLLLFMFSCFYDIFISFSFFLLVFFFVFVIYHFCRLFFFVCFTVIRLFVSFFVSFFFCRLTGMAVVFFPATLAGALDSRLLHAAEPAVHTKWVSQIWIRQGAYHGTPTARIPTI